MRTGSIDTLSLSLLLAGSILGGAVSPSAAANHLAGGYSEASATNEKVIADAEFAVKAASARPEQKAVLSLVGALAAQQQVASASMPPFQQPEARAGGCPT